MKDLFNNTISKSGPDMDDFQHEILTKAIQKNRERFQKREERKLLIVKIVLVSLWALIMVYLFNKPRIY